MNSNSNYYQLYINQTLQLAETIVIKSATTAETLNQQIYGDSGGLALISTDPTTWKYYLNLAGQYHPVDQVMTVISMDTQGEIIFNRENLLIHLATARAYAYGTRAYIDLVGRYPNQEQLILGILYPTDMATAIAADDGAILSYPADYVESNEHSLIPKLQQWINIYKEHGKWKVPHEIASSLVNRSRTYFEQDYKIKPLLPKILKDVLFRTGSYGIAVIPENTVDDVINGSRRITLESLTDDIRPDGTMRPIGILGPSDRSNHALSNRLSNTPGLSLESLVNYAGSVEVDGNIKITMPAMESRDEKLASAPEFKFNTTVSVTDNFNLLKVPEISQRIREQRIRQMLGGRNQLSVESIAERSIVRANKMTDARITNMIYKAPNSNHRTVAVLKTQDKLARRSVGKPLIMHLPSESIIPVHVPNRPDHQIGFFVMIDQEGNPVSRADAADYYKEMGQRMQAGNSFASAMLERSKLTLGDTFNSNTRGHVDYSVQVYGQMLEEDLLQRIRNGIIGQNAVIAKNEEIYRLMMARALANQHTQLLFIPAEFMTYIAFRYQNNGVGKSLLEEGKIINSMRTMVLVANVMASMRNSIGRTHVEISLDPDAPDPMKLVEMAQGEIMRSNSQAFPLGVSNPVDVIDYIQKSAFEFSITGHPGLPDMKVDFSEKNSSYAKPDTDLEEMLRKRSIMMYGLTPEMIDAASGSDFAASVNNNSLLLSKRVLNHQQEFTPQLSDHLRKVHINSADLMEDILKIVEGAIDEIIDAATDEDIKMNTGELVTKAELKANKEMKASVIKEVVEEYIANFTAELPEPDVTKSDNQLDAYKKHEEFVDTCLNAYITPEMFAADATGKVSEHIGVVREQMKAFFLRDYQIKNGILPELTQMTAKDAEGKLEFDIVGNQTDHIKSIMESIAGLFKIMKSPREHIDALLDAAGAGETSSAFSSDGGSNPSASMTDDMAGGSDFDFGGGGYGDDNDNGGSGGDSGSSDPTDIPDMSSGVDDEPVDDNNSDSNADNSVDPDAAQGTNDGENIDAEATDDEQNSSDAPTNDHVDTHNVDKADQPDQEAPPEEDVSADNNANEQPDENVDEEPNQANNGEEELTPEEEAEAKKKQEEEEAQAAEKEKAEKEQAEQDEQEKKDQEAKDKANGSV